MPYSKGKLVYGSFFIWCAMSLTLVLKAGGGGWKRCLGLDNKIYSTAKMKRPWIGRHTPITIGSIVKPWTHLLSPQCDVTRIWRMIALILFLLTSALYD